MNPADGKRRTSFAAVNDDRDGSPSDDWRMAS
jgi:hypothetical protein